MERYVKNDIYMNSDQTDEILGMANISPKRSGLPVVIWSDGQGILRKVGHNSPRVKIGKQGQFFIVVSIEPEPKIISKSTGIKDNELALCKEGIDYVARNHDLFLKHFQDTDFSFDDSDLFSGLRERGDYK